MTDQQNTKSNLPMLKSGVQAHALTKEERSRGGSTQTPATIRRNVLNARKQKQCKKCLLPCPFKELNLERSVEQTCTLPPQLYLTLRMSSEKNAVVPKLNQLLAEVEMDVKTRGNPRDYIRLLEAATKFAEYIEPKDVQVNVDVDHRINLAQLQEWFRAPPKQAQVVEIKEESEDVGKQ